MVSSFRSELLVWAVLREVFHLFDFLRKRKVKKKGAD
jgi:hypothetical protein